MIRKAMRADYPRISEIRLSVRESRRAKSKDAAVERAADWIFDHAAFWSGKKAAPSRASLPRNGTIFALFIHPAYEGGGIGRALLPLSCQILRDTYGYGP